MASSKSSPVVHTLRYGVLLAAMGWTAVALSGAKGGELTRGRSVAYVENKTYQAECTACHIGFLPGFLPARSWTKMMNELEDHFGENAALDEEPRQEILAYLTANAADHPSSTNRSKKIAKLIPADESPQRITELAWWTRRHGSVREWVWKRKGVESKAKCNACHREADKGLFDEHDVQVPKE
jgi:Dihaem cytochrome c